MSSVKEQERKEESVQPAALHKDAGGSSTWKILDLIQWGGPYLERHGVGQPRLSIEWIAAKVLGVKRLDLYLQFERLLSAGELAQIKELLARRVLQEPVQYLLGQWDFYGLPFDVSPHVLIPRPETELLVESLLNCLPKDDISASTLGLDLGTGSGNIAVAMLTRLPASRCVAVDLSLEALVLARLNARRHGVEERVTFREGHWFDAVRPDDAFRFDWIVSNPPYVAKEQWETLPREVRCYEPRMALWGGEAGMEAYPSIVRGAPRYLKPGGWMALEIGDGQWESVKHLIEETPGLEFFQAVKDGNGIQRVVIARQR